MVKVSSNRSENANANVYDAVETRVGFGEIPLKRFHETGPKVLGEVGEVLGLYTIAGKEPAPYLPCDVGRATPFLKPDDPLFLLQIQRIGF